MSEGNDGGTKTDGLTWTESRGVLGGGVDGDGEGVAGANHLLCRGDAEGRLSVGQCPEWGSRGTTRLTPCCTRRWRVEIFLGCRRHC